MNKTLNKQENIAMNLCQYVRKKHFTFPLYKIARDTRIKNHSQTQEHTFYKLSNQTKEEQEEEKC